ncbi:ABC transporter ATP-binding protein [Mycoplasma ovis str. Michigan]|uniref:ABC transporter ATP-binding protein n=1 Tax=Mycoplasma ovis str. Michigan TaxID=1415773 RepID=A0ABN4BLV6_9MOLU|nr:cysteine peptidase family C39 domain-containing protein [Mycoplasma ovis]AHC39802.1 ABC transporter ATP-binding protein [Mycoplasma ovis str. Michigan]
MKIYYQESENDCGISVTRSLINHFLKKEVSRTEIFNQLNISERGISIFELETVNKKYGIHLEAYKLSIKELQKNPLQGFFVMLLYRNNSEHFVIARKLQNSCILYDSELGKLRVNYQKLASIFSGKILLVEKIDSSDKSKILVNYSEKEISILKFPKLLRNISLELIVFFLLITSFSINKLIFEDVMQSQYLGNIASIIFVTMLVVLIWSLLEYIKSIYYLKDRQWYFKELYGVLIDRLEKKKNYFFSKLSENQYLMIKEYSETISLFYSELLSILVSSVIIASLISLYLIYLQFWFLVLIIVLILTKTINFYIVHKLDNTGIEKLLKHNVNIQKLIFKLNQFLKTEWDFSKFSLLNSSLSSEISDWQLTDQFFQSRKTLFLKLNFFMTQLINCSIYFIGAYLYLQKNITIATLISSGLAYMQLSNALDKLILNSFHWTKYSNAVTQFKHLLFNDNLPEVRENLKVRTISPKFIEIKGLTYHNGEKIIFNNLNLLIYPNSFIYGPSGIGKSTLYKLISAQLPDSIGSIFINGTSLSNLWENSLNKLVIYQNSKSEPLEFDWIKLRQSLIGEKLELLLYLASQIGIYDYQNLSGKELSDGQRQFANCLYLCTLSGKILLLDEVTSHINSSIREIVFEHLFPIIFQKNFVICSEHNLELKKFFVNHIDLEQKISLNS